MPKSSMQTPVFGTFPLLTDMSSMFAGAKAFDQNIGGWNVSAVTNMEDMFNGAEAYNSPMTTWVVTEVESYKGMFKGAKVFNQSLAIWATNSATDMESMFENAAAFDQNLNSWCVDAILNEPANFATGSGIEGDKTKHPNWGTCVLGTSTITVPEGALLNMALSAPSGSYVIYPDGTQEDFTGNKTVNSSEAGVYIVQMSGVTRIAFTNSTGAIEISPTFFTGDLTNLFSVFKGVKNGFAPDISNWDTSKVANFTSAFDALTSGWNPDVNNWDISNGINFSFMFRNCKTFNRDLSSWTMTSDPTKNVLATNMFEGANIFNSDLSSFGFSRVTNAVGFFKRASAFNGDVGSWDTANVTNFGYFFNDATSFNRPLTNWRAQTVEVNTSKLGMIYMFDGASSFNQPISHFDAGRGSHLGNFFRNCVVFNQDLSAWDMSNVSYLYSFFENCASFNAPIFSFTGSGTQSEQGLADTFRNATIFNQDISHWEVDKVTNAQNMFRDASAFNQDLSSWCFPLISNISNIRAENIFVGSGFESETAFHPQFGDDCGGFGATAQFTLAVGAEVTLRITTVRDQKCVLTLPDATTAELERNCIIRSHSSWYLHYRNR